MTHREKVDLFVADLAKRGLSEYTSAPPGWRAAWALGLKVPPPHFMGFIPMALACGIFFGAVWGVTMHFLMWRPLFSLVWGYQGWGFSAAIGLVAGTLFGVTLAAFYRRSAAMLGLPPWEEYTGARPDAVEARSNVR